MHGCPIPAKRNANDAMGDSAMASKSGVHNVGSSKSGTSNNGDVPQWIVGERVGEFFDLHGCPIPAKRNAIDAMGDSAAMGDRAMGESAGSKGDRAMEESAGSKGDRASIPSWKSQFSAKSVTKSPLEFVAPEIVNGKPVIEPPAEAVVEGMMLWEDCLVGQFFDKRLPLHVVRAAIEKLWGKKEIPEISITDNGLYLFRFKDMTARDWVMDCGPWYIAGRPFVIRRWQPGMEMLNIQLTSLPI